VKVTSVERILLDIPFDVEHERNMAREVNGTHIMQICRVTADDGLTGYGESLLHGDSAAGPVPDAAIQRVKGRNPFNLMWDDTLGIPLQMALFDLAGKAAGVPIYRLLGEKVRDWCPISWWSIDMPPADCASQVKKAVEQGYTSYSFKARPWFDVREQVRAVCAAIPPSFQLTVDFSRLMDTAAVLPVIKDLEQFPNVTVLKQPVPYDDFAGHQRLRAQTRFTILTLYGLPPVLTALREDLCDAFIIRGGTSQVLRQGSLAAEAQKLVCLYPQTMATGIGTAFLLHLAAVLSHARMPLVGGMNIYAHQLLRQPLAVQGGYCHVPEAPGLGVDVDEDALQDLATSSSTRENQRAIYVVMWSNGQRTYYGQARQYVEDFRCGSQPAFAPGVQMDMLPNDGSAGWEELYQRLQAGPLRSSREL
jgi:L-alanine-DL-glutamate epimerase-like enolase superfamily enzyme